ncbi:MAG: hypothetical protein OXI80_14975 [Caldilineaceae bacterium]|nr:hypothetical protein [Caldilineaceae bacterium]MDE0338971.1 hypothetical protein [Caldilineaceae bacterium]
MSTETRSNGAHQSNSNTVSSASDSADNSEKLAARVQLFESFFEQLYVEKDVYAYEDKIVVKWPRKLEAPADYNFRLQLSDGRIYAESEGREGDNGDRTLGHAVSIPDGEYELILMPSPSEYYVRGVRVQRRIPLSVVRSDYRTEAYGTYVERQIELLRHAVSGDDGLYSEIAKMTLGWWDRNNTRKLAAAVDSVAGYEEDHLVRLIALLGMVSRYSENDEFPSEIREVLDDCITGFAYHQQDYTEKTGKAIDDTESVLLAACELLAGQIYPDRQFPYSRQTGQWHRQRAAEAVLPWLQRAATAGFIDPSSHCLAQLLTTLSHLIDLADSQEIWDLAAVVIDKVLVTLALDSFQGVYGAGQITAESGGVVPNGHVSPVAGVARLMWGIGAWNRHMAAPVSLCCCQGYQLPPLIASLATEPGPAATWASERHAIAAACDENEAAGDDLLSQSLHKAIYRTPDYLLSSAQDFQPGQSSQGGQSWQATLDADAIVFVNHPGAHDLRQETHRNGYWRSGRLPRVAQHRDLLIALYALPDTDPSGFTRAYFPTFAFDEHQVGREWTFAAKGDAYIALGCSQPIELVQDGPAALRELRATGHNVAWICQMGRKADYGSFAEFRKRVLAARFVCDSLSVSYRPLQGDTVTFDWNGPLLVNGEAQPLHGANHYEGPNCVTDGWPATQMVVVHGEQAIQLDFAGG